MIFISVLWERVTTSNSKFKFYTEYILCNFVSTQQLIINMFVNMAVSNNSHFQFSAFTTYKGVHINPCFIGLLDIQSILVPYVYNVFAYMTLQHKYNIHILSWNVKFIWTWNRKEKLTFLLDNERMNVYSLYNCHL